MTANELRIGNLIQDNNKEWIVSAQLIYSVVEGNGYLAGFKPIPLTEEWLVKLGFKYMGSAPTLGINESWNHGNVRIEQLQSKDLVFHGLQIKYVHQLQNLVHALTGEELTTL